MKLKILSAVFALMSFVNAATPQDPVWSGSFPLLNGGQIIRSQEGITYVDVNGKLQSTRRQFHCCQYPSVMTVDEYNDNQTIVFRPAMAFVTKPITELQFVTMQMTQQQFVTMLVNAGIYGYPAATE
ncbi:MAG: hypothetical protein Q8K36_03205 [Alphaproteobacteria bacterium]|nr:hypothetical protein [Alphaproteobacteria bacterium]